MDGLEDRAFNQLLELGEDIPDEEKVTAEAKATFKCKYLEPLEAVKHKPRYIIELRGMLLISMVTVTSGSSAILYPDMHKEGTTCDELLVRTSQALNGKTLKLFCLSILRNDMESRIKDVIDE